MTTPHDFARVRTVFEAALERAPAARAGFVADRCAGDAALAAEVLALLRCDARSGELVPREPASVEPLVGAQLGAFRIEAVLGGGGMGTVYTAEQDEPRRRVALKVLSLGLGGDAAVRRFRWEAEVLARLRHPGIAQVYAVGTHRQGATEQPWFAMELVEGARDLVSFAAARQLSLTARLELLLQVCDAVHHGHLQGIVHRDLKPANVLVDVDGRVRVIDFGVARSLDGAERALGVHTVSGAVLGTPAYLAPEHYGGEPTDLRADVWALGVIAFELLAGRRAFAADDASPWAIARRVQSGPDPRLPAGLTGVDRELVLVVEKAMARDRERRYASVAALAADLRAWLEHRPVAARAPSTLYQLRLFARRRRGLVAALGTLALLGGVATVALFVQHLRLLRAERLAAGTAAFAREFLAESDLMQTRGTDYTVREALDVAAQRLALAPPPDAELAAELDLLIGDTYRGLSVPAAAAPHLERAFAARRTTLGDAAPATLAAGLSLVLLRREQDRAEEAQRLLDELTAAATPHAADTPLSLRFDHTRALLLRDAGRLQEAEAIYRAVAAARERLLGPDHEATVATLHNLGTLLLARGEAEAARAVLADGLARARRGGSAPASTWQIADNLAEAWRDLGDLDRAAATHREAIAGFTELLGADHALTLGCGYHLLKVLHRQGDVAALRTAADELLPRCERTFGAEHRRTLDVLAITAAARLGQGEFADAVARFDRVYAHARAQRGAQHPDTFFAGQNAAVARLAAGEATAALAIADDLAAALPQAGDVPPLQRAFTVVLRVRALDRLGRSDEARAAAAVAVGMFDAAGLEGHPLRRECAEWQAGAGEVAR